MSPVIISTVIPSEQQQPDWLNEWRAALPLAPPPPPPPSRSSEHMNQQQWQIAAIAAERKVAAASRKLGLQQHWIDFDGRKTSAKGRKGIIGSVEMADAALTQASARSLMAGYADSAANKQAAELRKEFGSRIETLESGFNTFSTQLQSVDSKMERQHSELLQAVRSKGKGGQGGKGKWQQQQQPLQPRFPQQQQQQQW